jgi:hypothetical protein
VGREVVRLSVSGPRLQIERFTIICKTIEKLCREGATRTVSFDVDGDGGGNLWFAFDVEYDKLEAVNTDRDPVKVPGINDY